MARTSPRLGATLALGLVAILSIAGCSSGVSSGSPIIDGSTTLESSDRSLMGPEPMPGGEPATGQAPSDGGAEEIAPSMVTDDDQAEIYTATLSLTVEDPRATAAAIRDIVSSVDGRVSYSVERPGSEYEHGSAQLVLRLPPGSLQGAIVAIEDYGVVTASGSGSLDVSQQKKDYEVRLESLRNSIDRLNDLLSQSSSTSELIEIERELQSRESELESMTAMLAQLNNRVDYATLTVTLTAESKDSQPDKVEPENFFTAFDRGLEALAAFGASFLIFLGASLPWIFMLAILVSIAMIFVALARRRRRKQKAAPLAARSEVSTPEPTEAEAKISGRTEESATDGRTQEG